MPKVESYFIDKCEIMLNYLSKHMLEVALIGAGSSPKISLENQGSLYFPPTCKNNFSVQSFELTNLTRAKLNYEWKIPYEYKKIISVDELTGSIDPHEVKKCIWKFSPDKIEKYNCKVILISWVDGEIKNKTMYNLRYSKKKISFNQLSIFLYYLF